MAYLSIVLVNYNGAEFLYECLNSINRFVGYGDIEVVIVDNSSNDGSIQIIEENYSSFKLIRSRSNLGFGKANNLGVTYSQGEYLLFLNTDTILRENSPKVLLDYLLKNKDVGVVSSRITFENGSCQLSCGKLPNLIVEFFDKIKYGLNNKFPQVFSRFYDKQCSTVKKVGWVTGACMMMHRDIFEQLGGFDENFFMYFEDKDICKRVKELGYKVVYYPKTSIIHLLGGSSHGVKKSVNRYYRESQLYYYQKHLGKFQTAILKLYLRLSGKV